MEVRTYRVPQIGSGTPQDRYRPKYLTEATDCGKACGEPCGVIHTATCECVGQENDGKGGTKPIMKELPLDAWVVTFRCHDALWALLDADHECVLLQKHTAAVKTEDVKALYLAAKDIADDKHPAVTAFATARKALNDEQARHTAEARALVGVVS